MRLERRKMARKRSPSDIVDLKVRMTEALRARIEQEAKKNNRSLNGEVIYRLGVSFGAEGAEMARQYDEAERELKRRFRAIVDELLEDAAKKRSRKE
jgi:hypothetical protein